MLLKENIIGVTNEQIAPQIEHYLDEAEAVITSTGEYIESLSLIPEGSLKVGVDLGTAFLVMVVLDESNKPLAGEYRFAQVVRDGLIVDYIGAINLIQSMKLRLETRLGREITHAACGYPPGVPMIEVRANANVVEAANMICTGMIDEPSAANQVLRINNGAIIDVGGGTTGIAIVKDGEIIYTADEATGGTHFSLVIAGALKINFEEAENIKKTASEQKKLFPIVRPVMEKIASIIRKHISAYPVQRLFLVGGSSSYPGMRQVIEECTGLPTAIPKKPLFVTPLGIAMSNSTNNQ